MSKILNLAQSFEQTSKQQVNAIEKSLQVAFKNHEQSISEALRSSEKKINADIHAQQSRMSRSVLKTWLWLPLTLITVLLASWGVIFIQGEMITRNWKTISQQNETLKELESKGSKIQISTCGKKGSERLCVKIDTDEKPYGNGKDGEYPWMIPEGY